MVEKDETPDVDRKKSLKVNLNDGSPSEFDTKEAASPTKMGRRDTNTHTTTKIKEADFNENMEIVKQSRSIDQVKE